MGGIVGRLFREFAMTVTIAVVAPRRVADADADDCSSFLHQPRGCHNLFYRIIESFFTGLINGSAALWISRCGSVFITLMTFLATMGLTVWLFIKHAKGFFPAQDTGVMIANHPDGGGYFVPAHG